jgi:Fe-S oxidoreductase
MLKNVIEVTERCRHSLMCRHVCPVGNLTRLETLTPHGWAQLVALERRGLSSWNPETVDALYKCADCGNCRSHCVYSNPLPEGIAAARATVAERGLAPPVVYELGKRLREWENPYETVAPDPISGSAEAALFVGDETRYLRPGLLKSAFRLLAAAGVEPALIGRGRNSGYLASSLGLPEVATRLARANLNELAETGARVLFLLTPGDFFAFATMYDERLGLGPDPAVELVQVIPHLARLSEAGRLRFEQMEEPATPYAYVDPTHSVRVPESFDAPRKLLGALLPTGHRELFWRRERMYPAGDLALQFTQPALADALTGARLSDAAEAGAGAVVSYGAGTVAYLERQPQARDLRVHCLYDLLAAQLRAAEPESRSPTGDASGAIER